MRRVLTPGLAAAAALALAAPAHATNGYFSHGYSVEQRALAGAGTAYANDALTVAVNPANITFLPDEFDVNLGFFAPYRQYSATDRGAGAGPGVFTIEPGTFQSRRNLFGIPAMAYAHAIDDSSAWGLALYGNGGMNTDYRQNRARFGQGLTGFETECDGTFGGGPVSAGATDTDHLCGYGQTSVNVDLIQLFLVPSYAHKLGDANSIGIAPVIAAQRFSAKGLMAFAKFSNAPDKVSDNGYDYSFGGGARAGVTVGLGPYANFGASYQSRIKMSNFDKYAGLFAGNGNFDIPSNWNLGVVAGIGTTFRLLADYQRVNYSEIEAVANPLQPNRFVNDCALPRLGGSTASSDACLGSSTGPGFGWRNVSTLKLGYEQALGRLILRAGWSKNHQPIPASEVLFNVVAPAVPQEHYTAGASWPLTPAWSLDLSAMYAKNHPVSGKNPLSNATTTAANLLAEIAAPGSGGTQGAFGSDPNDQTLTLEMHQYELMFGLRYRFGR